MFVVWWSTHGEVRVGVTGLRNLSLAWWPVVEMRGRERLIASAQPFKKSFHEWMHDKTAGTRRRKTECASVVALRRYHSTVYR